MEKGLDNLNNELEQLDIDDSDKDKIRNVYKSWKTCKDNQIILSDLKSCNIRIDADLYVDNTVRYTNISKKSSILFSNCQNININVMNKVNHILIEKSKNINLKTVAGIIGGIDVLHSQNVNMVITNQDIHCMSLGDVSCCNAYIDRALASNTFISTLHCHIVNFILTSAWGSHSHEAPRVYNTNTSLMSGFNVFVFVANAITNTFELHFVSRDSKGTIYPTLE
jgi:hypothetical protein